MTRQDLTQLQKHQEDRCVTVIVPTHRTMPERQQDPLLVKNGIKKAIDLLQQKYTTKEIQPLAETLDTLAENIDYTKNKDGLAFFVSPTFAQLYQIPFPVQETIVINNHFYLKDLIYTFNRSPRYWILAVSEKPTRLFDVHRDQAEEVFGPALPQEPDVEKAPAIGPVIPQFPYQWNYEVTSDRELLAVERGDRDAAYLTELRKHFYHDVDKLLEQYLHQEPRPVLLIGTQENRGIFKEVTHHPESIIAEYEGDVASAPVDQIMRKSWPIMQEALRQERNTAVVLLEDARNRHHYASGIDELWHMAQEGRINLLVLELNHPIQAHPDPNAPHIVLYSTNDSDITDSLIDIVLAKRGRVIFVDPGTLAHHNHCAAVLRY